MLNLLKRHRGRRASRLRHPSNGFDLRVHNLLDDPDLRRAMGLDRDPDDTADTADTADPKVRTRRSSKGAAV